MWHCSTTTNDLSLAVQKVSVAQHPDVRSPLSGTRLHVLGNSLHLTGTDDNRRGAIYHLDVRGTRNFWGVAPASFLTELLQAFGPDEQITIGTNGDVLVLQGTGNSVRKWRMSKESAFTLGCFAGTGAGWRTLEPHKYWLKGSVKPVEQVFLQGRAIHQVYDASDIFEETYGEEDYQAETADQPTPTAVHQPASAETVERIVAKESDVLPTHSSPLVKSEQTDDLSRETQAPVLKKSPQLLVSSDSERITSPNRKRADDLLETTSEVVKKESLQHRSEEAPR